MRNSYEDIIDLPHHVSATHPRMSRMNRAAQFSAFAALGGFDASIKETARLTDEQLDIGEDTKEVIDRKLRVLLDEIDDQPDVIVTYFQPDARKDGGEYVCIAGNLKKIDEIERIILLTTGEKIRIDDIYEIESVLLPDDMI